MIIALIGQKGIPAKAGGVERYTEEMAVRLVERGHEVVCYTRPGYTPKTLHEWRGVRLVATPTIRQKHIETIVASFTSMLHARFRVDPDMIIVHSIGPALMLPLMRIFFPKIPIISIFQSRDDTHAKWGRFARVLLRMGAWFSTHFASASFTVSKEIQTYCWEELGRFIPIIPNGISLVDQQVGLQAGKPRRQSIPTLVAVSRLIPHKRVEDIIRAVSKVKTPIRLEIFGDEPIGVSGYEAFLKKISAESKNEIVFMGTRSAAEINHALKRARGFIHASESEGASLAVLEALGAGLPLILSDIPSHRELDGAGVWRFPVGDCDSLAHQIEEMLRSHATPSAQPWQSWQTVVTQIEGFVGTVSDTVS